MRFASSSLFALALILGVGNAPPASAQTLQDIGRILDQLGGQPQRPAQPGVRPPAPRPPAQSQRGDAGYCRGYADGMLRAHENGRARRCQGQVTHANWRGHYDWCLRQDKGRSNGALSAANNRLLSCRTS